VTKVNGDLDPAFSLNGEEIVFDNGKIFTVHANGSHRHALTHPSTNMADEFPHFGLVP
jgi:hypothetical protein